jgi:hypothetical protein
LTKAFRTEQTEQCNRTVARIVFQMRPAYEEPTVPSSMPLKLLRHHLEDARARGEQFGSAWPGAVKAALEDLKPAEKREWRDCLEHTSTWGRCFNREPATERELALRHIRTLIHREPMPDRWCDHCGGALGNQSIGNFCSRSCSRDASKVLYVDGHGTIRGPMQAPELPLAA